MLGTVVGLCAQPRATVTTASRMPDSSPSWRDRLLVAWWQRRWRGFYTLQRLLPGTAHGCTLRFVTRYGSRFLLNPSSYIDGLVLTEGYYESEVLDALRAGMSNDAVFWDIGANFGLHSITLARLVPRARVVAFEPNPIEHARLLRHRAWNAPHVVTSSLALSDAPHVLPLHLGPEGNSGMTTLAPWSQAQYTGTVLVPTATGDNLIARGALAPPTVIKLDVEGHETAVLLGLAHTLRRPECTHVVLEDAPDDDTEPKRLLRAAGFRLSPLERRERSAHALLNFVAHKPTVA